MSLSEIQVCNEQSIEDFNIPSYHVDFANKLIGGGTLIYGNVQEEILFFLCPELLTSILFCEYMKDNEAIIITGAQRYSNHSGYGSNFQFVDQYQCQLQFDNLNRKKIAHIAIDAFPFQLLKNDTIQFQQEYILRELTKSTIGFQGDQQMQEQEQRLPIISGNWGCGMFKGDVQLKFIIQWLSCSIWQRKLIYCSLNNQKLQKVQQIIEKLKSKKIQEVLNIIINYLGQSDNSNLEIFYYLLNQN